MKLGFYLLLSNYSIIFVIWLLNCNKNLVYLLTNKKFVPRPAQLEIKSENPLKISGKGETSGKHRRKRAKRAD
jgi:hypothetical protein